MPVTRRSDNPLPRDDKKTKTTKTTETSDNNTKAKVNTTLTKRTRTSPKSTSKEDSDSDSEHQKAIAKAQGQRNAAISKAIGNLASLSNGGLQMSDMPGTGGGGPGAVNYSQAVLGAFDDAWNPPAEITDNVAVAVAKIRVNRSGTITEARIIKRSNNALMDRSVQNALEAVKSLPPFPQGATDLERVFNIEFNLKAKRATG